MKPIVRFLGLFLLPILLAASAHASFTKGYSYDAANHRSIVVKSGIKTYEMYGSNGNLLIEFTPSLSNKLVEYIYLGGKRIAQKITQVDHSILRPGTYLVAQP